MTPPQRTHGPDTSAEFFERLYKKAGDPWNFRHSAYERERYEAIINGIVGRHYRSAFEPGCSIGELTALLAPLCDSLDAMDFSDSAVATASRRCKQYPQVQIRQGALPGDIPAQPFELIVFSEIGYYFDLPVLANIATRLWAQLEPGGVLIACHWLGHSSDHQLHGQVVHSVLRSVLGEPANLNRPDQWYTLQRWQK